MIRSGIDEAGYGPVLGPLVIGCVSLEAGDAEHCEQALRAAGVCDSKRLYQGGRLQQLEAVALAAVRWCTGFLPDTAADLMALLGEDPASLRLDWQLGARHLRLPLAASAIPDWRHSGLRPLAIRAQVLHPERINASYRAGSNKAALEADCVCDLLAAVPDGRAESVVDRLSARRYHAALLQRIAGSAPVEILSEGPHCSSYRFRRQRLPHAVHFRVRADHEHAPTALASCLAKYLREIHMRLFNDYWCKRYRWLRPTAGYPLDARRWLHQIGAGTVTALADDLVRGPVERAMNAVRA